MAPLSRTEEQYLAAGPQASAWVSANAGTGKTHVLVDRVIRILLEDVSPERILCLTFTKAAAAEMSSRVHEALGEWVTLDDQALRDAILASTGAEADQEKLAFARTLFARTLETPGGLKIQTIHAFAESLLRRFPLEASISPHFEVLDEQVVQAHLLSARDRILKWGADASDADLNNAVSFLVERLSEDRFDSLITALMAARADLGELFAHHQYSEVVSLLHDMLGVTYGMGTEEILEAYADPSNYDEQGIRGAIEILAAGSKREAGTAAALTSWLAAADRAAATPRILKHFLTSSGGEWRQKAVGQVYTKKLAENSPDLAELLDREGARALDCQNLLLKAGVIASTSAALLIGHHILSEFSALKALDGGLDYNDLILKAGNLLRAPDVAPWVLYKLDGGIDHVLVDEAQDTSPEQWSIIWSIAAEFFAGKSAHEEVSTIERTVFAVGDQKQSIYRFQGADPEMFNRMNSRFSETAENAARRFEAVQLERSFRSTPEVLAAVDAVFANDPARTGVMQSADVMHHMADRQKDSGVVELWPTIAPDETATTDEPWHAPVDYVGRADPKTELAIRITDQIDAWLKRGERLPSRNRAMDPGDILILVQRRNDFFDAIIRELKARDIPVAGRDRMRLSEQLVVMDLMAIGRFAILPEDDLNLATVLRSPLCDVSEDELFDIAHDRTGTLWQSLRDIAARNERFRQTVDELSSLLNLADYQRPFEFYAHILGRMEGRKRLVSRLGFDAVDPMDEFLTRAVDYEQRGPSTLQGFLTWLERSDVEIKRDLERGRGEVRVMTVHGAKGLQAPVVFLPDTCSVAGGRNDVRLLPVPLDTSAPNDGRLTEASLPIWVPTRGDEDPLAFNVREDLAEADLAEYHRLLYVAMTRAEDRLYVCGFEGARGRGKGCWYDLVAPAIEELGQPVDLDIGGVGYRMGSPAADPAEIWAGHQLEADADGSLPAWILHDAPPVEARKRSLQPSHLVGEEPPAQSPMKEFDEGRFERGLLIHAMLQNLPEFDLARREEIARSYLERRKPDMSADERHALVEETMAVLNDVAFAPVFAVGSFAEVPLAGSVKGDPFVGQVDRLIVTSDEVLIIDFKTNRPPPDAESGVVPKYVAQMASYRTALRAIYPDHVIRAALLWTDGPRLMEVTDETLNKYAD